MLFLLFLPFLSSRVTKTLPANKKLLSEGLRGMLSVDGRRLTVYILLWWSILSA